MGKGGAQAGERSKLEGAVDSTSLSNENFRKWAQDCIASYRKKGAILDAMIWARIIAFYEAALKEHE
jgi:hypothetical protein